MNGHNHWISIKGNLIDPPPVVPWGATPLLAVQWRPSGEPGWQSEKRAVAWVHAKDPPEVRGDLEIPVQRVRGPEIEVRVITADTTQDVIASSPYHIWLPQEED
jgi:hypothetical protein